MKAKIEYLPGIHCSAKAILSDLMDSVKDGDQLMIIVLDKEGEPKMTRASGITCQEAVWALQREIFETMGYGDSDS